MIIYYDYILNKQNLSSLTEKEQDLFFLLLYSLEEDGVIENAEYKLVKEYIFDPSYSNKRVEKTLKSLVSELEKMNDLFVDFEYQEVRKGLGAKKYQVSWDASATKRFNNLKV